jgi:hypothetical protein
MDEKHSAKQETTVIVPFSLTDFAKAIKTFLEIVSEIVDLSSKGLAAYNARDLKKSAESLSQLYFSPEGVTKPLERLASGKGTQADVRAMREALADSAEKVGSALGQLDNVEQILRENFGLAALQKLWDIKSGLQQSKGQIRKGLYELADDLARREDLTTADVVQGAGLLMADIGELNKKLVEFHDEVLIKRNS